MVSIPQAQIPPLSVQRAACTPQLEAENRVKAYDVPLRGRKSRKERQHVMPLPATYDGAACLDFAGKLKAEIALSALTYCLRSQPGFRFKWTRQQKWKKVEKAAKVSNITISGRKQAYSKFWPNIKFAQAPPQTHVMIHVLICSYLMTLLGPILTPDYESCNTGLSCDLFRARLCIKRGSV